MGTAGYKWKGLLVAIEWLARLLYVLKILGLNFRPETGHPQALHSTLQSSEADV
jgi:hypothetical protein